MKMRNFKIFSLGDTRIFLKRKILTATPNGARDGLFIRRKMCALDNIKCYLTAVAQCKPISLLILIVLININKCENITLNQSNDIK